VTAYIATASKVAAMAIILRMAALGTDSAFLVQALVVLSICSMTLGNLAAIVQRDLKRLLAYSTIGQLSYVLMAAAILKPLSEIGAAIHIVAHAFGKITLFFAAGAIYTASKKTELGELAGIARRMPWTQSPLIESSEVSSRELCAIFSDSLILPTKRSNSSSAAATSKFTMRTFWTFSVPGRVRITCRSKRTLTRAYS
jgi:hypothetical protein